MTPSLDSGEFLFRFRSANALLEDHPAAGGFEEIENQAIYFATPESLNDPMEGLTDPFWDGDEVLWGNLFRHYGLALISYLAAWLMTKSEGISKTRISAALTEADLPTAAFRGIYREFISDFCSAIDVKDLAKTLGKRGIPLRRERLTSLLFLIHQIGLSHALRVFKRHGLHTFDLPLQDHSASNVKTVVKGWESLVLKPPTNEMPIEDQLELIGRSCNKVNHQLELGMLSRADRQDAAAKWIAIWANFPQSYVDAFLSDLHFTRWRVACFSQRCVNASMWGTYGQEHRGAALVFRTTEREGKRFFRVQGMLGTGGNGCELEVHTVEYRRRPPTLDSFLEIGTLPRATLDKAWMKSESGVPSVRLIEIAGDPEAWHQAHMKKALERATWKHPDWTHEAELRLIASTAFTDDPAPRPLTYDFSQLEGIVFGMRMTTNHKLRVAKIIEKKCRAEARTDFRFFQAHYSPERGEMTVDELGLLKFEPALLL